MAIPEFILNDDESGEVAWFAADAVPELDPRQARCLALALRHTEPWFARPERVAVDGHGQPDGRHA